MNSLTVGVSRHEARPARVRDWWILTAGVLVIWMVFSWPLSRYFAQGIPSSSQNIEVHAVRRMMPGDHLQLLYQYWLLFDMLAGRTPWFANVYEFNTGDDAARVRWHPHYMPFSLVFAFFHCVFDRAAAFNLTGLVSLWLTAVFSWQLARRYVADDVVALVAGLGSVLIPYRWAQLLGGSPAGHAMAWPPLIAWAVDVWIRDLRPWAGGVAGWALLWASWGDSHVALFGVGLAAGWVCVALLARGGWPIRDRTAWAVVGRGVMWMMLGLLPLMLSLAVKAWYLSHTTAGVERTITEVRLFAPSVRTFFQWRAEGLGGHVYMGLILPWSILALAGLVWIRRRDPRLAAARQVFLLLLAAAGLIGLLALGPRGPFNGVIWRAATHAVPPYRMVRQPAKILVLWPTLATALVAAGVGAGVGGRLTRGQRVAVLVLGTLLAAEYKAQVRATICVLDPEQGAYRAAAEAARRAGLVPRALVLPLWPGDSAPSSVYSYYASLYRIRLANGYSPAVRRDYLEKFVSVYREFNHGKLDDEKLDALRQAGFTAILFHEDSTEKISPYPAGFTLQWLRHHPRLEFLARDGRVWAFGIREGAPAACRADTDQVVTERWAPSRRVEGERAGAKIWEVSSEECSGGACGLLAQPGDQVEFPRVPAHFVAPASWWIRVRGFGRVRTVWSWDSQRERAEERMVETSAWTWQKLATPAAEPSEGYVRLTLVYESGRVELDVAMWTDDPRVEPDAHGRVRWAAHTWFRAGYVCESPEGKFTSVRLEKDRDPADRIFYGPWRVLPPGRYRVQLFARVPADTRVADGTELAVLVIEQPSGAEVAVRAGADGTVQPVEAEMEQRHEVPVIVSLRFTRASDLMVDALEFERLSEVGKVRGR